VPIGHDDVVMLTGRARGITAEVARRLAERSHAELVLVGRTALPAERVMLDGESSQGRAWPEAQG
jgi:NAD(P)-dependent dehydrogenase (short-subunit alcohol dehydrogenase family)